MEKGGQEVFALKGTPFSEAFWEWLEKEGVRNEMGEGATHSLHKWHTSLGMVLLILAPLSF